MQAQSPLWANKSCPSTLGVNVDTGDDPLEIFNDQKIAQATADFQTAPTPEPQAVVAPQKVTIKRDVTADHSTRQRQIITPTQASLNSFLETNSIFQPIQVTEQITAVDARLAAADSNLAALTNDNPVASLETQTTNVDSSVYSTAPTPTNLPQPPLISPETATSTPILNSDVVLPSLDTNSTSVASAFTEAVPTEKPIINESTTVVSPLTPGAPIAATDSITAVAPVTSVINSASADNVAAVPLANQTTPTTVPTIIPPTDTPNAATTANANDIILPNLELPGTPILSPTPSVATAPTPPLITSQ